MVILIMGPTGSGKTTVGTMLASHLGWQFADADDFHPPANVEKMSHGLPLNDQDRAPWLAALRKLIVASIAARRNLVLACSALKEAYRHELVIGPEVKLVYLKGDYTLFARRIHSRKGHFAKEDILAGQFRDLQEPENAVTVDAHLSAERIVSTICEQLGFS